MKKLKPKMIAAGVNYAWQTRQDILTATPRNIGAPERAARQCMPIDFYLGRGK